MKPLIAVHACHKYDTYRQAVHDTWYLRWRHLVDIRFFIGNPAGIEEDVVYLDCPDDFASLGLKTRGLARFARQYGYTNVFKCDDDTFIHIPRLLASGYEIHEYVGRLCRAQFFSFAQGGAGYWLSGRALDVVADSDPAFWLHKPSPHINFEDLGTGLLMHQAKIGLFNDPRYFNGVSAKVPPDAITVHKCLPPRMHFTNDYMFPSIEKTEDSHG